MGPINIVYCGPLAGQVWTGIFRSLISLDEPKNDFLKMFFSKQRFALFDTFPICGSLYVCVCFHKIKKLKCDTQSSLTAWEPSMPWSSMASELSTEAQALGPPPSSHRSEIHSRTFASDIITSLNLVCKSLWKLQDWERLKHWESDHFGWSLIAVWALECYSLVIDSEKVLGLEKKHNWEQWSSDGGSLLTFLSAHSAVWVDVRVQFCSKRRLLDIC